jgi:hypothetical protein
MARLVPRVSKVFLGVLGCKGLMVPPELQVLPVHLDNKVNPGYKVNQVFKDLWVRPVNLVQKFQILATMRWKLMSKQRCRLYRSSAF